MEKKSLSQQTADRLYTMIVVERRLSPGEKLPSELDLSRELGVSRTTLREAIHVLASQKILEVRRGRGTFVAAEAAQVNDYGFSSLDQVRGELRDLFDRGCAVVRVDDRLTDFKRHGWTPGCLRG